MAEQKIGNPAVVGLAGFGLTTMVLQFHNVGWMGIGPVIWLGLIFGGLAQMIAGLQEMKTGNNFGYCAFTAYGCFWIALALLLIGNHYNLYVSNKTDIGWFLIAWTASWAGLASMPLCIVPCMHSAQAVLSAVMHALLRAPDDRDQAFRLIATSHSD